MTDWRGCQTYFAFSSRSSSKQPYVGAFQNCYQTTDPNHPSGFVPKPHGFNFTDVCLGGCSLTGSNVGGSNTGSLGFQAGEISVVQTHELSNPMSAPSHTSSCSCSDWRTRGEISCAPNNIQCPCSAHLDPCSHPMWMTGTGQAVIQPTSGGCADDRHSTPAGSDSETGGGGGGGGIGLGRKFSARVGTHNFQSKCPNDWLGTPWSKISISSYCNFITHIHCFCTNVHVGEG